MAASAATGSIIKKRKDGKRMTQAQLRAAADDGRPRLEQPQPQRSAKEKRKAAEEARAKAATIAAQEAKEAEERRAQLRAA